MKHFNSVGLKTKKPTNKFISWLFAEAGGFEPVIFHQRLVNRRIVLSVLHCLNFPLAGRQAAYGYSPYNSVNDHADCAHKNCACHMK